MRPKASLIISSFCTYFFADAIIAARDVKSLDVFGWSPFHYVALLKDYDSFWIVRELWKRHDIPKFHQTLDRFERTPIHVAVAAGSDQILQYTIEYLEDLDSEDRENVLNASGLDQATILHLATKNGLYDRVKDILKMGRAQSVTRVDLWGREAIHLAARHGHHDIASRLLQEGAQPYHIDKIGMSPLEYLIHGDVGLREVQASDNPKDMQVDQVEDGTPIPEGKDHVEPSETSDSLVIRKRKIFVEFAMKNIDYHDRSGKTFLHHAIQSTDIKTVENLMNKGYKVNQSDSKGSSALHLAVGAGRENLALFMLRNSGTFSVDPSAVDKQGETALMFAVREGYLDLAKRLISGVYFGNPDTKPSQSEVEDQRSPQDTQNEGCDPRTQNLEGRIALQIAISEGYHEIVRYLLKLPKLQDEPQEFSGESLLVTACKQALPTDCVLAIIEAWPTSINDADQRYHQTPLSWACEGGSEEIVKLLLDMDKVDVNKQAQGWRNYSPLHFAARNNNASIVQMLLNHTDIKTELKTAGDSTATDLAIQSSHAPVVEAFLVHRKVDAQARLQHLKRIAGDSDEALHGIIRNIFVSLPDKIIHDSDLLELLELTKTLQCTEPYLKIVERALTRESTWKDVKPKPMHVAARLGSLELIEKLCGRGVQLTDLDEDGWTCLEYADTYRSEPLGSQVRQFIQGKIPEDHRRKDQITPDLLDLTILHGDWMSCNGTSSPGIWSKPNWTSSVEVSLT
jgi:ankyrin repeat protein